MDTNIEDKMYHQIERSLSNNINENLFSTGRVFEKERQPMKGNSAFDSLGPVHKTMIPDMEHTNEAFEYIRESPTLSRAEYIRQAREACLRQMNVTSSYKASDEYEINPGTQDSDSLHKKKPKILNLFHDGQIAPGTVLSEVVAGEGASPQEIASFRFLIIRTVCAIVIFISIFAFDKLQGKIGSLSFEAVKEYVIGNDRLQELENIIVTWLK